jgi:hypothetical protein
MNRIKYINNSIAWWWLLPLLWLAVSCSKNEEPPKQVGQVVPFQAGTNRTLVQVMDSIPDLRIYDSIYHHSDLGHTLDSLRGAGGALYTLFAPSDAAFQKAGITLAQVGSYAPAVLDSIVFYLTVTGPYTTQGLSGQVGYQPLNTFLQVTSIASSYVSQFYPYSNGYSSQYPYIYSLTVGWTSGLMLNGKAAAAAGVQGLAATDGVLWELDTVILKPTQEAYAVIAGDTSFNFYMAVCRFDDSCYAANVYNARDTPLLQMQQGQNARTYFVPTNNAFRKAGFQSVSDIYAYILTSQDIITGNFYDPNYNTLLTNVDSILNFCQTTGVLYTQDILHNTTLSSYVESPTGSGQYGQHPTFLFTTFAAVNGQVVLHRQDFPGGRAATVIAPADITTLNGVVHSLDNLLLPQP